MLTKEPSNALQEFVEHREVVIQYIRAQLKEQGFEKLDASMAVAGINMWGSREIENLYKCINSDLDESVIKSIVVHDFNGLRKPDPYFLPKSRQFEDRT